MERSKRWLVAPALVLAACSGGGDGGGGGAGGGGASGTCTLVGEPVALPHAPRFVAAAAGAGRYVVVGETDYGQENWQTHVIDADGVETFDGGPGRSPVALADGPQVRAFAPGGLFQGDSMVSLRTWSEGAWGTPEPQVAPPADTGFLRQSDLAVGADGTLALGWISSESSPEGSVSTAWVHVGAPGTPLGEAEPVFAPDSGLRDAELHLAVGADGAVHVLGTAYLDEAVQLVHRVRAADGTWSSLAEVGPAPGVLGNVVVTGLAASGAAVYAAETHPSSFRTDTEGATTVYRWADGAWAAAGSVPDPRAVTNGLGIGSVGDDAVVVAVSYGQNNLDAAESEDSVELHHCSASGCGRALVIEDTMGVFYERVAVVTHGAEGAVVWSQSFKGDSAPALNQLQRFTCATSE